MIDSGLACKSMMVHNSTSEPIRSAPILAMCRAFRMPVGENMNRQQLYAFNSRKGLNRSKVKPVMRDDSGTRCEPRRLAWGQWLDLAEFPGAQRYTIQSNSFP